MVNLSKDAVLQRGMEIYGQLQTPPTQETLLSYVKKPFGEKRTYPQDWPLYEKACSTEKLMFLRLLKDAVDHLEIEYTYQGNGRPPVDYVDIVKSLCIKAYHQYSSWRTESELRIARAMGIVTVVHKRSTLNKYMLDEKVTRILQQLYKVIAEPLANIEVYFAADATGISKAYGNKRWQTIRHTKEEMRQIRGYNKLHVVSGVKTNVITAAKITEGRVHESPHLKPLLDDTAQYFTMKEVSADAGYLSKDNVKHITSLGAVPYIVGKKNTSFCRKGPDSPWTKMLKEWKNNQMYFHQHYHRRSNVESTFAALKRKFGGFTRCKTLQSQENEILSKIVCYNACILAESLLSYDLDKGFVASL